MKHERSCASLWTPFAECDCEAGRANAEDAIATLESVNRALEVRVAELELDASRDECDRYRQWQGEILDKLGIPSSYDPSEDHARILDAIRGYSQDRFMRALVHIRSNAESQLHAQSFAGTPEDAPEAINARWNYTEANSALTGS